MGISILTQTFGKPIKHCILNRYKCIIEWDKTFFFKKPIKMLTSSILFCLKSIIILIIIVYYYVEILSVNSTKTKKKSLNTIIALHKTQK